MCDPTVLFIVSLRWLCKLSCPGLQMRMDLLFLLLFFLGGHEMGPTMTLFPFPLDIIIK